MNTRSSDSPAAFISRECMSRQTLQPLIWLARISTRWSVVAGTPEACAAAPSCCSASIAPGTTITGFSIRGSMEIPPIAGRGHIRSFPRVYSCDTRRSRNVTMTDQQWLAEHFEQQRPRLRAVAYRMLGSLSEADDVVQEAWLRASRAGIDEVENLDGWLTTIVARVALNALRARKTRREQSLEEYLPDPIIDSADGTDPEH